MKTIVQLVEELKEYLLEKDTAAKQAVESNIAPVEADASSASRAYVVGEQLFLNDVLYDVTSPISVGDAIAVGTNITAANKLSADIQSKQDQIEVTTMPTASASNVGKVLIYIGATTSTYTSGQSYQSTLEGGNYIWKPTSISSVDASDVVYDNQTSGLTATDSQAAIDELASQNQTLTSAFANNVNVNGSKNLFVFDIESLAANTENDGSWNGNTYTKNGISITINDDNMVFSGTPTNNSGIHVLLNGIPKASYMLSGLAECTNVTWGNVILKKNGTQVTNISHFNKADWNLDLSSYDYDSVDIEIKREKNNVAVSGTLYPMLSLKTDYDLDSTWVAPSKTNLQLTQDSVTWDDLSEVGAVNYFNNTASSPQTDKGVTYTVDATTKKITATGTNDGTANSYITVKQNLKAGTYRCSGCPSGGSNGNYRIVWDVNDSQNNFDYGDGVIITLATDGHVAAYFNIMKNYAISGSVVFEPMITSLDYNGPYVPYAKSNKELTDELTNYLVQKDYNFVASNLSEKQNGAASFDAGAIGTRGCRCTWDISDEINSGLVPISSMITDFFDSSLYFSQPCIDINNKIIKLDIYRSTTNAVSSARTQIRITYAKKNFMTT